MTAQIVRIVQLLNKNPAFRLLSSVKLAVPLMLILGATVSWGTIVESKYNAEMAKIVVYESTWFSILLVLLWLNILCATISRIPFRLHHLGFVITHIGLLMLLAGGVVTSYGIDGTLAVVEGFGEDKVSLSKLVVGVAPEGSMNFQTVEIPRGLSERTNFTGANNVFEKIFTISSYIPFAEFSSTFERDPESSETGVGINLKSQFFNVTEFLHTKLTPKRSIGPALLEIVSGEIGTEKSELKVKPTRQITRVPPKPSAGGSIIEIVDIASGKILHTVDAEKLRKSGRAKAGPLQFELKTYYRNAVVAQNKLVENPEPGQNAAMELMIKDGAKEYREVLFARFPDFSISQDPERKFKLVFKSSGDDATTTSEIMPGVPPPDGAGTNVVRLTVDPKKPDKVLVELFKNGDPVLSKIASEGESIQTPWMGMLLTVASIIPGAEPRDQVKAIEPPQRENLPTGALAITPSTDGERIWIAEGDAKTIINNGREYTVYFGRKIFRLPFKINLEKFYKKDYPGTETAMSYESDVKVSGETTVRKISMNEPLYRDGFTVYQSSYQMNPGGPATSIFSINRDPGRNLKYFGSLILCVGIVIFVLMRSSYYRKWKGA